MPLYADDEFVGINAACVQEDQPLDAFVERLFWHDEKWLLTNGNWLHHGLWREKVLYDQSAGDRAYASVQESCIFVAPYVVPPTLSSLELVICGRVNTQAPSPAAGTNKVRIKAELAGVGSIASFFDATTNYADLRLTIPVTQRPGRPFATQLRIWILSQQTELVDTGYRGIIALSQDIITTNSTSTALDPFYLTEVQPSPSTRSFNDHASVMDGLVMDHIYRRGESQMVVHPSAVESGDVRLVRLSYLQMRGFALREVHAPAVYPPEEIRALIPLLGQTAAQHPVALLSALARPQLVSLGHPGQLDYSRCTGSDLPEAYTTPFQWRAILGDEGYQTIHRQPLLLDEARGRLEIRILYVPVYVVTDYTRGTFEALQEDAPRAEWTFYGGLSAYEDGSGAPVPGDESSSVVGGVAHLPTDQSGVWPLLLQRRYAGDAGAWAPGDERPTYKEGHLYGPDLALVQESVVSVPLDGVATDKATCLEITASLTGAAPVIAVPTGEADATNPNRLQLVVVGVSVWAHYAGGESAPVTYTGKQIAGEAAIPSPLRFAVGGAVRALDWQGLAEQANRLWARRGSRGLGRWFEEASDLGRPWVTQSTTPTATAGYTGVNERLSNISGPAWCLHDVEPAADRVRLYLEAHGRNINLTCAVYALDTGALLGTLSTSAADWELMSDTLELTTAQASEGGSTANPRRLLLIQILAESATDGGTGRLTYWQLREEPITNPAGLPA